MTLGYTVKLGLKVCFTNVRALKINNSTLKLFKIVLASFQVKNKLERAQFFSKILLLTNLSIEIGLELLFLSFNNTNIQFT